MKQVLIFSVAYFPFVGGAEVAVREVTRRLGDMSDIEFHLVTVNLNGREKSYEKIDNVHVYRVGHGMFGKYIFPITGVSKAILLHKRFRFSAVWSIMASYGGIAALLFTTLRPKVKFILSLQEGDPVDHIKRRALPVYPFFWAIFKKVSVVHVISNYLAEVAKDFGVRVPIKVIPNGVDTALFGHKFSPTEIEDLKQRLGKIPGDRWLVTTSRLTFKNGIDTIIRTLPFLPENIILLILGEGELEVELKNLSEKLCVESRVIFLGIVSHAEMPKYLKICDVFVRPSRSEGLGNSFIEAMAAGLPIIGTNVGGIPDFLKDRETGLFCEVDNPMGLAADILTIIDSEELRLKIVHNGREFAIASYDWQNIAEQMNRKGFAPVFASSSVSEKT